MIITCLGGGLGNQMFQYSLGLKLSIQNNDILLLDTNVFNVHTDDPYYRAYGLKHFNIESDEANADQIRATRYPYGVVFTKLKNRWDRLLGRQQIKFEPYILKRRGNIYLEGYWQSYKYFKDIRETLIKEFSLKNPYSPEAQKLIKEIKGASNAVSIHIRRGDYVKDPESIRYYGSHCNQTYYEKALKFLEREKGDLSVFVFSDDIVWAQNNISIPHRTIYAPEHSIPDYERMMIMSLCDHHVIANSTFGWWSAWLNDKPGKIVIGPSVWIPGSDLPIEDIMPSDWVRM